MSRKTAGWEDGADSGLSLRMTSDCALFQCTGRED